MILNELQLRYKNTLPRRMRAYAALAEEKYQLPTYPVLINILKPDKDEEIPSRYQSNCLGLEALQDYRVINLWSVDYDIVFQEKINSLLPFVPILKGGDKEEVVREALKCLRLDENLNELETLLAFFATFVLDINLVQEIMRWDMAVLMESPWYQEIEKKGEKKGKKLGRLEAISGMLEIKFGSNGLELMDEINQIEDVEILKNIINMIKTVNSLEELRSRITHYKKP